jgi:hypothetical protein
MMSPGVFERARLAAQHIAFRLVDVRQVRRVDVAVVDPARLDRAAAGAAGTDAAAIGHVKAGLEPGQQDGLVGRNLKAVPARLKFNLECHPFPLSSCSERRPIDTCRTYVSPRCGGRGLKHAIGRKRPELL